MFFNSPYLSYLNELGLYFKKIKDFPLGSMIYLHVTLHEKFQITTK